MAELKMFAMKEVVTEQVQWLWQPYIPAGKITIVQGDPGNGKTTMLLAIAAAVTRGLTLPQNAFAVLGSVIFQTAEDGLADTIKPRLEQLGADCGKVHVIDEGEEALSLADGRIEQAIVSKNAKLLILDPLQAYLGGSDMHSANGVRPLMKQLANVAERTGCAIVLIGHLNKKGGKSQYRGLGSIDIYAAARSVLTVGKIDVDEGMRGVVHNKSNLAVPGASLAFGLDPVNGFCWLGEYDISIDDLMNGETAKPENQFSKACKLIKTMLSKGAVSAAEMMETAEEEGISLNTLKRAKSALGVLSYKRFNGWFWELPIDVAFTECAGENEKQGTQEYQETQDVRLGSLSLLPERAGA